MTPREPWAWTCAALASLSKAPKKSRRKHRAADAPRLPPGYTTTLIATLRAIADIGDAQSYDLQRVLRISRQRANNQLFALRQLGAVELVGLRERHNPGKDYRGPRLVKTHQITDRGRDVIR